MNKSNNINSVLYFPKDFKTHLPTYIYSGFRTQWNR